MSALLFWDTSALSKKYVPEKGSSVANAVFSLENPHYITFPVYAEVIAVILRRKNQGELSLKGFQEAMNAFEYDVTQLQHFQILETDADTIMASIPSILRHNLNSSDAAILATYLRYASSQPDANPTLISADLRLNRAARAEGLFTLNPQEVGVEEIPALLASLSTAS